MPKSLILLLFASLFAGCSNNGWLKQNSQETNRGYFADASECSRSAMRKEAIKVPTAGSVSVVEVPTGYDADKFMVCMEYAGRPVSRTDLTEYLNVSNACLHEAQDAKNPDEGYADCIRRSRLNVEIINNE